MTSFLLFGLGALSACRDHTSTKPPGQEVRLWHTFNPHETEALNDVIARVQERYPDVRVRATVIPFSQAQNAFRRAVTGCAPNAPDVFRAELPWLAGFVERGFLRPAKGKVVPRGDYLAEAADVGRYRGKTYLVPTSVDGLALLYNKALLKKPPQTLKQLISVGQRLTTDRAGKPSSSPAFVVSQAIRWGFYVRADGYWFLPFLWAHGGQLLDPDSGEIFIDKARAVQALSFYRDLARTHHIAPPHLRLSNDYEDQLQRFGRGELAMMVNGPWAARAILKQPAFREHRHLGVAPLPMGPSGRPTAPMSGHGFVVSRCAKDPALAWKLAMALADGDAQMVFAERAGLLPAIAEVYDRARVKRLPLIGAFRAALKGARARPAHPIMARIFDDFTPAVQAVLLGDAQPKEALAAVAKAWRRLLGPPTTPATAPATAPAGSPAASQPGKSGLAP
ncbi:MAG: extracellular solute-binding protein [Deltaproteobacteria bacterium]|nr:extracellular solute-binding protein [Deltaproteobacteria bacterium]